MHKFAFILILAAILVPSMLGYVKKSREVQERYESAISSDEYYAEDEYDSYDEY